MLIKLYQCHQTLPLSLCGGVACKTRYILFIFGQSLSLILTVLHTSGIYVGNYFNLIVPVLSVVFTLTQNQRSLVDDPKKNKNACE